MKNKTRAIILVQLMILQLSFMQGRCQDKDSDSSYLSLSLSASRIITGSLVTISGMSIKFGTMKDVEMTVKGNAGTEKSQILDFRFQIANSEDLLAAQNCGGPS